MLQFQSPNNYDGSLALSQYQFKKTLPKFFIVLGLSCWLCLVLFNLDNLIGAMFVALLAVIPILIFFGIIFLISYFCLLPPAVKRQIKSIKFAGDNVFNIFTFNDNGDVYIETTLSGEKFSELNLKSSDIHKFVVTKEYIFMFISKLQAFVINKALLSAGETEELQKIMLRYQNKTKEDK